MINREQVQAHFPAKGTHYDVIVCGGGPAGFGAAMASAHAGAKTLLLELARAKPLGRTETVCTCIPTI